MIKLSRPGVLTKCILASWLMVGGLIVDDVQSQSAERLGPDNVLGIWEFNSASDGGSQDRVHGAELRMVGGAALSASGGGRSGDDSDRSLNLGTTGSTANPTHGLIDASTDSGNDFLRRLNESNAGDRISVVFWQRWDSGQVSNSSSVWMASPSSGAGDRGLQAHLPWGNQIVYFDTSGCCGSPDVRLNGGTQSVTPPLDWEDWNHIALIKDRGSKQVWINGQLVLNQASGATPLKTDWNAFFVGQSPTEPDVAFHGRIDDLAVFGVALTGEQIEALAGGGSPTDLVLPAGEWPPEFGGIFPLPGTTRHQPEDGIEFLVSTSEPNTIPVENIQMILNGVNVSGDLEISGNPMERIVKFSGSLAPNAEYDVEVRVRDSEGRESVTSWAFDTLAGSAHPVYGAIPLHEMASANHNGDRITGNPHNAVDQDFSTISQSPDEPGASLNIELEEPREVHRVELVSPSGGLRNGMDGLVLNLRDVTGGLVISVPVEDPGAGKTWSYEPDQALEVGELEITIPSGQTNGAGNHIISIAELIVFTTPNFAEGATSYMMRFNESLPPTEFGNDGDYTTHTESTPRAVGSFFEVDLGEEKALYQVRVIAPDGFQSRMTHTTVRVYDGNHQSVFSEHLGGQSSIFDVFTPGPIFGRYVRVGFENKERSEPGTFWYLGLAEIQAFGRPKNEVGILSFEATPVDEPEGSIRLDWRQDDLKSLHLYPVDIPALPLTSADGSGGFQVQPEESTQYILVGETETGTLVKYVTVMKDGEPLPLRINELSADNRLALRDSQGNSPDWIEIHNPNATAVMLTGYGLSDDRSDLLKWQFPDGATIEPHGYVTVLASDTAVSQTPDESGEWHTPFALQAAGESLFLTMPDGVTIVDEAVSWPAQREDLSFGRTLAGDWAFLEPTPGAINISPAYTGWLGPVEFSHIRGFYSRGFQLSLNHTDNEAVILVSTDGGATEEEYVEPILIDDNTSVMARVIREGYHSPRVQTHTYFFIEQTLTSSDMNQSVLSTAGMRERARNGLAELPTINISVAQQPDDWNEYPATMELFIPGQDPVFANAGVERFGGAWTTFAKKNYRLKFRKEYGLRKLEAPLFAGFDHGIQAVNRFDELDLRGGGHDMASRGFYMSSRFSEDTMLDMGSLNPHGRFINLYFNGRYWGQYHVRERLTDAFLADYLGGQTEDYTNVRGNDNEGSGFVPGTPDPVNRAPWMTVLDNRRNFEELRRWVDIPNLIDFMIMWNFGNAETEFRSAGPVQPDGSGFKFWLGDADGLIRTSGDRTGNAGPGNLFGGLVAEAHPDFMALLADRIHKHLFNDGAMTPAQNTIRLEKRLEEIHNSLVAECARWGYRTPQNWESEARNAIQNIFPVQTDTLISRFRARGLYPSLDAPVVSVGVSDPDGGTEVSVSSTGGIVYFTTDGSDPRLPGGDINPASISFNGGDTSSFTDFNSSWNYLDAGNIPQSNWTSLEFDDSNWKSGQAPLGYGDSGLNTEISFGGDSGNKAIAYHFRKVFTLDGATDIDTLTLSLVRDDGIAVYLNGVEVVRDNLPAGELTDSTRANSAAGGNDETLIRRFPIDRELLRPGQNVLAVRLHQASPTSSDARFDLELTGTSSAGLTIPNISTLNARVYDGGRWSALESLTFSPNAESSVPPEPGDLIISEIAYNPDGSDEYEFIEIMNISGQWLDLSGCRISGGIDFLMPSGLLIGPDGLVVAVENLALFEARFSEPESPYYYPGILVAGQWSGALSNSSEMLRIDNADGIPLVTVTYNLGDGWPVEADGGGSSLEIRDPLVFDRETEDSPIGLSRNDLWKASRLLHGSPGRIDDIVPQPSVELSIATTDSPSVLAITIHQDMASAAGFIIESSPAIRGAEWSTVHTQAPGAPLAEPVVIQVPVSETVQFFRTNQLP